MFEPLYTAEEMRRAEEGHDVAQLMDRAGKAVADHILADYPGAQRITIVCGGGNNGGDGRVAGQYLEQARLEVRIVDAKAAETDLGSHEVLVDALFGTGFSGEPRPDAARLIEGMNASDAVVVAVDLPSGVDASTGEVAGAAVEATSTVTFHGAKVGHYVGPGTFLHGFCVEVVDIGLDVLDTQAHRVAGTDILQLVPRRSPRDNKYSAGALLVVGGSSGMSGAAALAARAAFRADAGYVTIAAPAESIPVLETLVLEAVKRPLDDVFDAATPRPGVTSESCWRRPTCPRSSMRTRSSGSSRSRAPRTRRRCSPRTRGSSRVSSARSLRGSTPTGWRRSTGRSRSSTASSC